jgi:alpha-glucosidase
VTRGDTVARMSPEPARADPDEWWRSGVLYQIYVRSFADSNGDGTGDLQGVLDHLDHLEWLGVDGIWLSPICPSPDADWGYDVSDFTAVHPDLGDLETLDRLVAEAGRRDMRVILDVVPNHTSDRHPWFQESRSGRTSRYRDWYLWRDPKPDGGPPNNWVSSFGGPAWTWDDATSQYYLHNFLPQQPDLNWWNEEVREAFRNILRFWLDRGVAGFRIDVANGLVKDASFRDNPAVTEADHPRVQALGLRPVYNLNRPEVHEVLRDWRKLVDSYEPSRLLLGETWVLEMEPLMRFYGSGADELHLAMNFPFMFSAFGSELRAVVEASDEARPPGAWPAWNGSNHDVGRFPTRWCEGDERKIRAAMILLLTLRGTPILYAGDEIGMPEVPVPRERLRDPVGLRGWPDEPGRDPGRTPMQWTPGPTGGFTAGEPWLPMGDAEACNVEDQTADPGSVLHMCRELIALRRSRPALRSEGFEAVEAPEGAWAWRRGPDTAVAVNCSDRPVEVPIRGEILLAADRGRDGERAAGGLRLGPWEAAVLATDR